MTATALPASRTLPNGTTFTFTRDVERDDTIVICDNPAAPADMRNCEVGRAVDGPAFQPAAFAAWALSPGGLRAIADLLEETTP